jgi:hypothetical protein
MASMRYIAILVALFAVLVPTGAAAEQSTTRKAKLHVVPSATLTLRGTGFVPGERVKVTVTASSRMSKRVVAGSQGGFAVQFSASFDRCSAGIQAFAVGERRSRASMKLPDVMCPPRL